jgi:hypothetical protein
MESASIWDIYSNAKKFLPLYERMQNRSIRQECLTVQSLKKDTVDENSQDINMNDNINKSYHLNEINMNYLNNEDIVSLDLLTPLSSSPANFSSYASASKINRSNSNLLPNNNNNNQNNYNNNNINNNNNNNNNNNDNKTNKNSYNNKDDNNSNNTNNGNNTNNNTSSNINVTSSTISSTSNRNNSNGTIITPTSMTESPNDPALNSNNKAEPLDNFKNYSFVDIIDFKNDEDFGSTELDFDILKELQRINESTNLNINSNSNSDSNSNSISHPNLNLINNDLNINIIPHPTTIKPLDIKIKSDISVAINNQNILSNNDLKNNTNINTNNGTNVNNNNSNISGSSGTLNSTNLNNNTSATTKTFLNNENNIINNKTSITNISNINNISNDNNISNKKPIKLKTQQSFGIVNSSSTSTIGQIPQSNKIHIEARQSKLISSSAPTKENNMKPLTKCNNCGTTKTPLWRKDPNGNTLCNACGLFLKLHGTMRPLSLKTDVIRKRNSKRQSISAQGEGYKNLSPYSQNQKFSNQSPTSYIYFPQSFPNSTPLNNFTSQVQIQQQHYQSQNQLQSRKSSSSLSTSLSHQQSMRLNSNNSISALNQQSQIRAKNVPILPKPVKDSSSPGTPTSSNNINFSMGSLPSSQPQDIPHFKRRKSKLNLANAQASQPSSPLTTVSFSPSSTTPYSPVNNLNNSPNVNISGSPANGISILPRSLSRNNSISSTLSFNLYQDINNKRGLSYSNVNQLSNFSVSSNNGLSMCLNTFSLNGNDLNNINGNNNNNNNINNNNNFGSPKSPASLNSPNPTFQINTINNKVSQQRQNKPSNFSNLSAGMNAIRVSSTTTKSGLSKCVANVNDNENSNKINLKKNIKPKISDNFINTSNGSLNNNLNNNTTNNNSNNNLDIEDLDWLKFDI